jgi:phage major head subunit gpT-like protein
MLITPTNLSLFFSTLETKFWTAYETAPVWHNDFATMYNATSEQFVAGWIGMVDKYRYWAGSRVTHQPAPQTYTVQIQPFELTEQVDQFKLLDDQYGINYATVPFMGMQAKKVYDYQLRDLILNLGVQTGGLQNGLDGLTHWNTAHPIDYWDSSKGTYCNDFRGGGFTVNSITVGGAFGTNSFNTLWEEFASRKSESNEPLGLLPNMTMTPPQLKAAAQTVLQSTFYAPPQMGTMGSGSGANAPFVGAMENPLKGWTDLAINPDLATSPTTWFMLQTNGPIKPFGIALREAPNFVYRVDPTDPVVFDRHTYLYGSYARFAPMWSFAWLSAISGP